MLEQGNLSEAQSFLSEKTVHQSERILLINTHNAAIDAVLNQKGFAGQQKGIDVRFRVNGLSALKPLRADVTIVFTNLIDNAMKDCVQMPAAERWVSVQILYSHEILSISIITPSRPIQIIEGKIATTKLNPPLHGFGLRNVEDILEKYHAEYTLSCEDGRFIFAAN